MVNKVFLLGRLGADPEIRYTQSGSPITNFNLATSEYWQDSQGKLQEQTHWHRITLFGKQAERAAEKLKKGDLVFIEGSLTYSSWEDRNGSKKITTTVKAQKFKQLPNSKPQKELPENSSDETQDLPFEEDDIPF